MQGISQGSRGIVSDGLMSDIKFGDDSTRAIAESIGVVDATVASRLAKVRSQEAQDRERRVRLGVRKGICMDCKEPIPQARLDAVPFASRCKGCQEAVEP